jgi:hypothetical protein
MPLKPKTERIVSDDIAEATWLRMRRLTSSALCRRMITNRQKGLPEEILLMKAEHTAWAVKTALGYWQTAALSLNARILMRYYALLQITIAEQIASSPKHVGLEEIQKHTVAGHGLFTITEPGGSFPDNYFIGCLEDGHFSNYCRFRKERVMDFAFKKRPRSWDEIDEVDRAKLISLPELIARVPELQNVISECLGIKQKSFQIYYDGDNLQSERALRDITTKQPVSFGVGVKPTNAEIFSILSVIPHANEITSDDIERLEIPLEQMIERDDDSSRERIFTGFLWHPTGTFWFENIKIHKSGFCGTSCIEPFWGSKDNYILNFVIMYALSIIVRYLPSVWHEIEDGQLDSLRALLEQYTVVMDKVMPLNAIERITGHKLQIVLAGTGQAPV